MPFTLIHGIFGYALSRPLGKGWKIPAMGFLGGFFPDIDGFAIVLQNSELYSQFHRALLHNVFAGAIAMIAAGLIGKKFGLGFKKPAAAFGIGFAAHLGLDAFFAYGLPVRPFWPLSNFQLALFEGSNLTMFAAGFLAFAIAAFLILGEFRKRSKKQ